MTAETNARGLSLAVAAQATLVGAWVLAALGAVSSNNIGFVGLLGAVVGFVLFIVAHFLGRARFGVLGPLAGSLLALTMVAALAVFFGVERGHNHAWSGLAALVWGVGVLAGGVYLAHFVAALALWRAGARALALVPALLFGGGLVLAGVALGGSDALGLVALAMAFAGHIVMLVGLVRVKDAARHAGRAASDQRAAAQ